MKRFFINRKMRPARIQVAMMLIALTTSFSAIAQERGDVAFGVNGLGGIYVDKMFSYGIGFKLLYNVSDLFRLAGEADFSSGLKLDDNFVSCGFQDYSVYAHYLLPISNKVTVYPLAGVGMFIKKSKMRIDGVTEKVIDNRTVGSFGAGVEYAITSNLSSSVELRFKHHGRNHYIYLASIAYKF